MSLLKPAGIQGLNTGDPLYANLVKFWEVGQTDKELVARIVTGKP